jgi:hypothetical protein
MRQVLLHSLPHFLGAYTSSRETKAPSAPTRVITFGSGCEEFFGHADNFVRPSPNERVPGALDDNQISQ